MSALKLFAAIRERRRRSTQQSYGVGAIEQAESTAARTEMTDSSLTTDALVDFQCRDCSFKATGTYADVEIACRAHRHPNLSLVAIDSAERERLWTVYFEEALAPLLADTAHLPQPYPRYYILGGILTALSVAVAGALLSRWLVETWYPTMGGWIHGSFMLLIVGGLVYTLMRYENNRRAANIRRFRVVAACNHHIRNALQVLIFNHDGFIQQDSLGIRRQIADAVHRIELTLSEVFPRVL